MVKEKKLLCRNCARTYPVKKKVAQVTFPYGIPVERNVKLERCPKCHGILEPMGRKK